MNGVSSGGDHVEAVAHEARGVIRGEAMDARDASLPPTCSVNDADRLEHRWVLDHAGWLQAESERKIRRADIDPVEPRRAHDRVEVVERRPGLDHYEAHRYRVWLSTHDPPGPDTGGRVAAGGNGSGGLISLLDQRHDHPPRT